MSIPILRRLSAVIGVLALSSAAAFVAVAPADAAPGNINPAIPRSLTIHKIALGSNNGQDIGTGKEVTVPGDRLAGATFTAAPVLGVDLTTPEGWEEVYALDPDTARGRVDAGNTLTQTTGADGIAKFTGLPIGLYLVTETVLPAEATNEAEPFLVTVPFPTGAGGSPTNEWIYDVHAYPKNAVTDLTKVRVDALDNSEEARNPDLIRWAISLDVPTLAAGDAVETFTLVDTLPVELEYETDILPGIAPSSVDVTNRNETRQNFVEGTDYTLVYDAAARTLTADFLQAGLTKLTRLPGGNVTLTVLTRAVAIPADGTITNAASSVVNDAVEDIVVSEPIGQLTVYAFQEEGRTRTKLSGAVYRVYLNQTDATLDQNAVFINGFQDWITGADGYARIPIITTGTYYVREVAPPAGFQIPVKSEVLTTVTSGPSVLPPLSPVNYIEFEHDQVPAFALPLTGGDGALWFTVGGIGLISIALGTGIVASRRRNTAALADA